MTPAEDAVVVELDRAEAAIARARGMLEPAGPPPDNEPPDDDDPPPASPLCPQEVTAEGEPGAVRLRWAKPVGHAQTLPIFVSWGAAGWLGNTHVDAGATTTVIPGLRPVAHNFDVGYVGGVGLARVSGRPLLDEPADDADIWPALAHRE